MSKRQDPSTRARRLLALLPHLHKGDVIPLADLARAVGCSPEEAAEDLTTLTMCGIPPFTPLDMVDLYIDGDFVSVYMDPPGLEYPLRLTIAEARAMNAALEVAGYAADSPLRTKLKEASSGSIDSDELERTIRAGAAPGGAAETYSTLAAATEEREKITISYYTASSGRASVRVVRPWTLVQRMGTWYLVAWCENAAQERVFRLDRIRSIERMGARFDPPDEVVTSVVPDTGSLQSAMVRFAAGAALPDIRMWPGTTYDTTPDGTTIATVPYRSVRWLARRVVARLGAAEVLSPPEARRAVQELASELLTQLS